MAQVGFTTGSLYRSSLTYDEIIKSYYSLGADAIELSFAKPKELLQFNPGKDIKTIIHKFKHVTIHAPWKKTTYKPSDDAEKIIGKLTELCTELPIEGIVLHPDTIEDFYMLDKSNLPFLIENMDVRKKYGTHPEQFRELKEKYNFGFVLDVQHAYEHDPDMNLAKELVDIMGDRLKHMHISGQNELEGHIPVHLATNKEAIEKILTLGLKVPKVLEGIIFDHVEDTILNELKYARSFELIIKS